MTHIIANFKANKNYTEMTSWIELFKQQNLDILSESKQLILCPSHPFLSLFHDAFSDHAFIHIGAQDVSTYPSGAHTGEVVAESLVGLAKFVLIGHSERRTSSDTSEMCLAKYARAKQLNIEPILLVRGPQDTIPHDARFVAYEPIEAIGTGNNMPADTVVQNKKSLSLPEECVFIYGGSVTSKNVHDYTSHNDIDGVLPGKSSLDPFELYTLISRA